MPPGQSVALLSQPRGTATDLFDVIAGAQPGRAPGRYGWTASPCTGWAGAELDRYRARRGLVSPRFPLLPSLSVIDNVLAAPPAGPVAPALGRAGGAAA